MARQLMSCQNIETTRVILLIQHSHLTLIGWATLAHLPFSNINERTNEYLNERPSCKRWIESNCVTLRLYRRSYNRPILIVHWNTRTRQVGGSGLVGVADRIQQHGRNERSMMLATPVSECKRRLFYYCMVEHQVHTCIVKATTTSKENERKLKREKRRERTRVWSLTNIVCRLPSQWVAASRLPQ